MKLFFKAAALLLLSVGVAACGGDATSSSGLFGKIPSIMENYENERNSLEASANEKNHKEISEKIDNLKEKTISKLTEEGQALNGKELPVTVNAEELKIEEPLTLEFKDVFSNLKAVDFGLAGKITAAKDLPLIIDAGELKGHDLFGGSKIEVSVTLPVHIELLDAEGNVVDERTIGKLVAQNNGDAAVITSGTPVEIQGSLPIKSEYMSVTSARLTIDLSKGIAKREVK